MFLADQKIYFNQCLLNKLHSLNYMATTHTSHTAVLIGLDRVYYADHVSHGPTAVLLV